MPTLVSPGRFSIPVRSVRRGVRAIRDFLDVSRLCPADASTLERVDKLRAEARDAMFCAREEAQGAWPEWAENMRRLAVRVEEDDPRWFLRWDEVRGAMFVYDAAYAEQEIGYLRALPEWGSRWKPAIRESAVGAPLASIWEPESSDNLIHHAYHVAQFERATRSRVQEFDFVCEFGGGYGSMARLLRNLGCLSHILIFDLPMLSALKRFYLKSLGEEISLSATDLFTERRSISCISDMGLFSRSVLSRPSASRSLFIGTWSLSEAPISRRLAVLNVACDFNGYLLSFQREFGGVDNLRFSTTWMATTVAIDWRLWEKPHLPDNFYLVGIRGQGTRSDVH